MLRSYGADRVGVLDGGLRSWTERGGASCNQPCRYPPARFTARPRNDTIVQRPDVVDALADQAVVVIDALDAAHYRGERADYGRPGHLPGALNVPAEDLVDPSTGRYRPLEQLGERFGPALTAPRVVTYCGAGVGAASDALVLTALGHDRVAVYDGSLLEWARDPDLPLETSTAEA
jgi:thiosulfate/3-mercaptopyruvate sulfurtransferase